MNKRLLIVLGLGIVAIVGAIQLIEFQKHGPAGQKSDNGLKSTADSQRPNVDLLPPGTSFMAEGSVARELGKLRADTEKTLANQQQIFDAVGEMTPEQEANLSKRLATAREATIRTFTKTQIKGIMKLFKGMLATPEYPGTYNHVSPPDQPARLSWRVHFLPWLGHRTLYNQFHLEEPWNSPHNESLLKKNAGHLQALG